MTTITERIEELELVARSRGVDLTDRIGDLPDAYHRCSAIAEVLDLWPFALDLDSTLEQLLQSPAPPPTEEA